MAKKIMVLVVAYNAEATIRELLDRIPEPVWQKCEEILVSDDCSKDSTAKIALEYKNEKNRKNLTVVRHEKNQGYGGNQKFGYNYAIQKGYDIAIMLHGDVQYAPEEIPSLLPILENDEADFVFGSRMTGHPLKGGMPLYKFFGNKFLTAVENIVLGTHLSEFHSGFRMYSCHALNKVPFNLCSNDFFFDSEIIIQLHIAGLRIREKTIPTHYGNEICYVKVIPYGLNILRILGQYILTRLRIKKYAKFNFR